MNTGELLPRDLEGGYRLIERIGEGGMGVVYGGTALALDRPVAVKMLRPTENADTERVKERFLREAKLAASIESAHVVDVLHFGETADGELFLVMEYLRGVTLEQVLTRDGRLPAERVVHIGVQMCRALGAAHDLGVVHRDLKPANVMLVRRDGVASFVKVLDFGIAKLVQQQQVGLTGEGIVVGTFHSIAPEQVTGLEIDGRADIYALGALLYRVVSGQHVFEADDAASFAYHHVHSEPMSLLARFPELDLPDGLDDVIMRCLEKHPDSRFSHMREVADALLAIYADPESDMPTQSLARHLGLGLPSSDELSSESDPTLSGSQTQFLGTPPLIDGDPTVEDGIPALDDGHDLPPAPDDDTADTQEVALTLPARTPPEQSRSAGAKVALVAALVVGGVFAIAAALAFAFFVARPKAGAEMTHGSEPALHELDDASTTTDGVDAPGALHGDADEAASAEGEDATKAGKSALTPAARATTSKSAKKTPTKTTTKRKAAASKTTDNQAPATKSSTQKTTTKTTTKTTAKKAAPKTTKKKRASGADGWGDFGAPPPPPAK